MCLCPLQYVLPQSNAQFSATWDELWQAYTAANALYASVVSHCVDSPTDTIWVSEPSRTCSRSLLSLFSLLLIPV